MAAIIITKAFNTAPKPKLPNLVESKSTSSDDRVRIIIKSNAYRLNRNRKPIIIEAGNAKINPRCPSTVAPNLATNIPTNTDTTTTSKARNSEVFEIDKVLFDNLCSFKQFSCIASYSLNLPLELISISKKLQFYLKVNVGKKTFNSIIFSIKKMTKLNLYLLIFRK